MVDLNNKYLFIFAISVFLVLSISGAGIYLNDEWMVGQQLNQLSQGHQLLTNEGKYGYNMNGTIGNYMTARVNILIYPLALPLISLPAYFLFSLLSTDFTRYFIIFFWGLLGLYIGYYIRNNIDKNIGTLIISGINILVIINLAISTNFIMTGKYVPYEMIPIVFTNIILFGIFSVTCFKVTELLFTEKFKQLVGWILCISMTSLIFWSTTLKDHMLMATLIMLMCYLHIACDDGRYWKLCMSYFIAGLLIWIRPEVGICITAAMFIFDLYYYFRYDIMALIVTPLCLLPGGIILLLNNYFVTGNATTSPFLVSTINQIFVTSLPSNIAAANQTSSNIINHILWIPSQIIYAQVYPTFTEQWVNFIFSPLSGAVGLIVPLCLVIFSVLVYIKHRPVISQNIKFLIVIGLSSISYYLLMSGSYIGVDNGIIPDIRYFTTAYTILTLAALSLLPYDINYRKVFKNIFIYVPIVIILALFIISIYPPAGGTYKLFRIVPEIISTLSLATMLILLVNDKNDNPSKWFERLIPIVIASAFTWQIVMVFVYHISKAHYYPMFLPITEFLYKLLFGV